MNSVQGRHQLPIPLYTENQVVSHSATSTSTVKVCSPALLYSYNIINDVFIQIWKHPCKGSDGVQISRDSLHALIFLLTPLHPGVQPAVYAELLLIQRSLDVQPHLLH